MHATSTLRIFLCNNTFEDRRDPKPCGLQFLLLEIDDLRGDKD